MLDTLAEIPALSLADQQPIRTASPRSSASPSSASASPCVRRSRHSRRADRARPGDDQGVLRPARRREAQLFRRRRAAARGYTPFEDRDRQGRDSHVDLKEFLACSAASWRAAIASPSRCPANIWPDQRRRLSRDLPRIVPGVRRCRRQAPLGDRALSRASTRLVRPRGQGRQFGAAPAPLSAGRRRTRPESAPARTRTST